ncbi:zinc finger domain-containing protein [uncultured Megasphaera sp.]|uniref:zinc finger domain-containing protein n=1 Tax=uncultured Megasphaera sp. TaxID=165188 RepID=UPI003417CB7D
MLRLSIRECGSSIRNYRDAEGNAGAFQNSFAVYGRAGEKCVRCGSVLKKITIGGRTSTFCEKCQKS